MKKSHDIEKFIQHHKKTKESIYDYLVENLGHELVDEILLKLEKEYGDNYKMMNSKLEVYAHTFVGYFRNSIDLKYWEERKVLSIRDIEMERKSELENKDADKGMSIENHNNEMER